jgi:hypothetical protein
MRNMFLAAAAALLAFGSVGTASAMPPSEPLTLYFKGEALWLNSGEPASKALAFDDSGVDIGEVLLSTDDLGTGYDAGTRLTFGMTSGPHSFEVVYSGLQHWNSDQRQQGTGADHGLDDGNFDTFLQEEGTDGAEGPALFLDSCCFVDEEWPFEDVRVVNAELTSDIDSFEFNYRHRLPAWFAIESSALVGFRWVSIDERFGFMTDHAPFGPTGIGGVGPCCFPNPPLNDFGILHVRTSNDLYGIQAGWVGSRGFALSLPYLGDGTVSIGGKFKAGMFGNDASMHKTLDIYGYNDRDDSDNHGVFSTVVEAGLQLAFEFHGIALTMGYEVLRVGGLAMAVENLPQNLNRGAWDDIDTSGSQVYHGPSIGLAVAFDAGSIKLPKLFP